MSCSHSFTCVSSEGDSCAFGSQKYFVLCGFGGILSCGTTHTAVVPLDLVKCRLQVCFSAGRRLVFFILHNVTHHPPPWLCLFFGFVLNCTNCIREMSSSQLWWIFFFCHLVLIPVCWTDHNMVAWFCTSVLVCWMISTQSPPLSPR